jgi:hypothetical protein
MNILEAEDMVKGLPDQVLFQYAQNPPPQIPQFLAISEVQRRQDMRQRFQARQGGNEPTVKDQILQGGIAGAGGPAPGGGEPPPMAPPGAASPGAPMQQPMTGAPMPPAGMYRGGQVPHRMQEGRTVPSFLERSGLPFVSTPEGSAANREALSRLFTPRRAQFSVIREAQALAQAGRLEEATALLRNEGIDPARALSPVPSTAPPMEAAVAPTPPRPRLGTEATSSQVLFPGAAPAATPEPPVAPPPNVAPGGIADVGAATRPPAAPGGNLSVPGMISEMMAPSGITEQQQRLIDLIEQQRTQGVPAPLDLDPYRQAALQRQKEARDEARRMAIAGTLTSLGAGVMGGDPAAGLRQATQVAMDTLREGRREAAAEGRSAEQLQLQSAQQQRQAQIDKMQFDRETIGQIANIYGDVAKNDRDRKDRAAQLFVTYDASVRSNLANASQQQALDNRAFLNAVESAEERIEDMLTAQMNLSPEQKDQMREKLVERAIRQYGAMIPTVDVTKVLKLRKTEAEKPANAQSRYQVEVVRR